LPADLEARFREQVREYEQKQNMPYVTSIEQYGMEKGQLIAYRQNILDLLEARFGTTPFEVRERVQAETDLQRLRAWHRLAGTCAKLEDFRFS